MNSYWTCRLTKWLRRHHAQADQRAAPLLRVKHSRRTAWTIAPALLLCALFNRPLAASAERPLLKLRPVPFKDVTIQDPFWGDNIDVEQIERYETSAEIIMHHGPKPADDKHAFDARDVMSNLASKIVKPS